MEAANRREWRVAVGTHALFSVLYLGMLAALELGASIGGIAWGDLLGILVPRVGGLVALEASLLLLGRVLVGPLARLFFPLVVISHAFLFIAGAVTHRYFVSTGTHLDWSLVLYVLKNAGSVGVLLGGGFDGHFALTLGVGLLFLVLAAKWSRRRWAAAVGSPFAAEAALLLLGAALWMGQAAREYPDDLLEQLLGGVAGGETRFGRYEAPRLRGKPAVSELPNVVFIILESFRADVVGAYRPLSPGSDTPSIDALAAEGLLIESAYATVTHTSKALVGIHCGGFPRLQTEIGEAAEGGLPLKCLPRILEKLGYRTRFVQSAEDFENRSGLVPNMGFQAWKLRDELGAAPVGYLGGVEEAMVPVAMEWAREAKEAGEPLFLSVLTSVSHHPYQLPGEPEIPPERWLDEESFERYRRAVHHVDRVVGRLVEGLRAVEENTLFVIVSDHGEAFGEHGPWGHNLVPYESGVHVPMLLVGPRLPGAPGRIRGLRHQVDLVPTLLDYLSVEWEGELPGRSLFDERGHDHVVSSCWQTRRCIALRKGELKFIYEYEPGRTRVFDVVEDPLETRNIVGQFPPPVVGAAEARMRRITAEIEALYRGAARARR